ncbi:putative FAD-linked oxidoreductase [compost metagenome]
MSALAIQSCGEIHHVPSGGDAVAWLRERFAQARVSRSQVQIQGAGTHSLGSSCCTAISMKAQAGIVEYDPSDLVVTVRCGTPLIHLEQELARYGQMLGFEPIINQTNTVGGAIALGWSGSRRPYAGALRDHLIGIRMIDGQGRDLRFGGRVVKNVAGFDVARLAGGSRGMLGALLEVTLRVMPRPEVETTVSLSCTSREALQLMLEGRQGPGPLSGTAYVDGHLHLRYSGTSRSVQHVIASIRGDYIEVFEGPEFWRDFVSQKHKFFSSRPGEKLWRVSVRPDAPLHPSTGALDWAGGLRWIWMPSGNQDLYEWARKYGGYASPWLSRKGFETNYFPSGITRLSQGLADIFDPYQIFDRSALVAPGKESFQCE